MTAVAEKDTCKYEEKEDGFLHTDCGKKIERVKHES